MLALSHYNIKSFIHVLLMLSSTPHTHRYLLVQCLCERDSRIQNNTVAITFVLSLHCSRRVSEFAVNPLLFSSASILSITQTILMHFWICDVICDYYMQTFCLKRLFLHFYVLCYFLHDKVFHAFFYMPQMTHEYKIFSFFEVECQMSVWWLNTRDERVINLP